MTTATRNVKELSSPPNLPRLYATSLLPGLPSWAGGGSPKGLPDLEVTLPEPDVDTFKVSGAPVKFAIAVFALSIVRVQSPFVPAQAPDQPEKTEPVVGDRTVQSVLDRQGRIIGWFSWEPERSMSETLSRLNPLLAATGFCLIGFAGCSLWQISRTVREAGACDQAKPVRRR